MLIGRSNLLQSVTMRPTGPHAGGGFSPTDIANLLGWWKADTGVTGSPVTAVADQSGNGFNLGNTGTVPFNATGFNGFPAFDYAVANNAALSVSSFDLGTSNLVSVFVVGQMKTGTASSGGLVCYGVGATNDYDTAGNAALITRSGASNVVETFAQGQRATGNTSLATNYRIGVIYDGTQPKMYINNVAGTDVDIYSTNFTDNGVLVIGNRYLGSVGGAAWDGPVAEIVVYEAALDGTQRNNLDAYFVAKYGL